MLLIRRGNISAVGCGQIEFTLAQSLKRKTAFRVGIRLRHLLPAPGLRQDHVCIRQRHSRLAAHHHAADLMSGPSRGLLYGTATQTRRKQHDTEPNPAKRFSTRPHWLCPSSPVPITSNWTLTVPPATTVTDFPLSASLASSLASIVSRFWNVSIAMIR